MSISEKSCLHENKVIIVTDAFDIFEMIALKCTDCGEIVKTKQN